MLKKENSLLAPSFKSKAQAYLYWFVSAWLIMRNKIQHMMLLKQAQPVTSMKGYVCCLGTFAAIVAIFAWSTPRAFLFGKHFWSSWMIFRYNEGEETAGVCPQVTGTLFCACQEVDLCSLPDLRIVSILKMFTVYCLKCTHDKFSLTYAVPPKICDITQT